MKVGVFLLAATLVPATALPVASGRVGVYAIVESVTFEPAQGPPQRIRINGAFAYAEQNCADCFGGGDLNRALTFSGPMKGYMYFQLPELSASVTQGMIDAMRLEWNDIKSVAGSGEAIAFGSWRYAAGIDVFRDIVEKGPNFGLVINGKSAIQVRTDSATGAALRVYETNVGVVKLSVASHSGVINMLRIALRGSSPK